MKSIASYQTIVFDCDGVVLHSNFAKIDAYREIALQFGANPEQAEQLVQHHIRLGGISRYPKFEYFLREIMQTPITQEKMQCLLDGFTQLVREKLKHCQVSPHLAALRQASTNARWMMISGGDQQELRDVMQLRDLQKYFDAGIFGSPDNKQAILSREIANGCLVKPALFIGDSHYDYFSAHSAQLDFVFLHAWTDVEDWQAFCQEHQIEVMADLGELIN